MQYFLYSNILDLGC